jgi:Immunoglobulin-like domain of bacterial spore germination
MRRMLLVSLAVAAVAWVIPSAAAAALTATQIRIGNHPAFVRVVVDFTGGTLNSNAVESPDPAPFDGRARVRVTGSGITTHAARVDAEGVVARVLQRSGSIVLRLSAAPHRFKYLEHGVLHSSERLVVDLWKARPPSPSAEFVSAPQGGCLTLDNFTAAPGLLTARGTETDLFEHMFQANVRNRHGRVIRSRSVTATGGHWHKSLPYDVSRQQAGTLEAVDLSEQDGSLACIVQVRVTLKPS